MTTATLKEIYEADLLQHFPDHTFAETTVDDETQVDFKDGSSAIVFTSIKPDVGDAYKEIRENVVGFVSEFPLHNNIDTIQTTDATLTTITTETMDDEAVYVLVATVLGIESDNSNRAAYQIKGSFYRTGAGNATQLGSTTSVFANETDNSWTGATFAVSGNDILVQVQGAASTTINWECVEEAIEFET